MFLIGSFSSNALGKYVKKFIILTPVAVAAWLSFLSPPTDQKAEGSNLARLQGF
jgi:hypothetical protein